MTRFLDRERAKVLRAEGKTYTEIKQSLGVSKGTLSAWLRDMPLTSAQIERLENLRPRRIERFRETMRRKRQDRLDAAYLRVKRDIGRLSFRDRLISGFYLYWGEGMKAQRGTVGVANTDPAIIRAFLKWLQLMRIPNSKIWFRLHLYIDMDIKKETRFWAKILGVSVSRFRNPYIKKSTLAGLTYKNGHGHGTCNVLFENIAFWEYIMMAMRYIREEGMRP